MSFSTLSMRPWQHRPDDTRFLTMQDLKKSVKNRRDESWTATPSVADLRLVPSGENGLGIELYDPTAGERRIVHPTHWGFNQLAQYAKAPASYMRQLPAELAAINLQWGLEHSSMREDALILARSNSEHELRAMTSTSYGRIWDHQIVDVVEKINHDGRWQIPSSMRGAGKNATTLYASDRDVDIFMVDEKNHIEIPGEKDPLYRGFMVSNSEVGAGLFSLVTFLYRWFCSNRVIYGATNVRELNIRHTAGAPDRFSYEGAKYLRRYAEESPKQIVATIRDAQAKELPGAGDAQKIGAWLQTRGFTKSAATASIESAVAEEGEARTVWQIVNGITAHARSISHTDARVELETRAGKLLTSTVA